MFNSKPCLALKTERHLIRGCHTDMPFEILVCVCIMIVFLQALDDVHEQHSHRDLKAGNVMVSGWEGMDGLKIHLIDWANSRRHDEGEQVHSTSQSQCQTLQT